MYNKYIVLIITYAIYYIFLFKKLLIDYFFNFLKCTPIPFISHPFISVLGPCNLPPKESKQTKTKTTTIKLLQRKLQCVTVYHIIYFFAQTALLADVLFNESLNWFEAFAFCCAINTELSPALLSESCVLETLQLCFCRPGPFTCSSSSWIE